MKVAHFEEKQASNESGYLIRYFEPQQERLIRLIVKRIKQKKRKWLFSRTLVNKLGFQDGLLSYFLAHFTGKYRKAYLEQQSIKISVFSDVKNYDKIFTDLDNFQLEEVRVKNIYYTNSFPLSQIERIFWNKDEEKLCFETKRRKVKIELKDGFQEVSVEPHYEFYSEEIMLSTNFLE